MTPMDLDVLNSPELVEPSGNVSVELSGDRDFADKETIEWQDEQLGENSLATEWLTYDPSTGITLCVRKATDEEETEMTENDLSVPEQTATGEPAMLIMNPDFLNSPDLDEVSDLEL